MNHEDDKMKYPKILGNDVVMIFALKEWCEQAALVPSDLYGYGMVESLRDCVSPPEPWRIVLLYLMSGDVGIVRWRISNTLCMY